MSSVGTEDLNKQIGTFGFFCFIQYFSNVGGHFATDTKRHALFLKSITCRVGEIWSTEKQNEKIFLTTIGSFPTNAKMEYVLKFGILKIYTN